MKWHTFFSARRAENASAARPSPRSEFRLVRYFSLASLVAFLSVAALLYVLERRENNYFREVQQSQRVFVTQIQESFARQQEEAARRDLLLVHEAGHVNLTRLLANAIWDTHVAPLADQAQKISTEHCHAGRGAVAPAAGQAATADCFAAAGKAIAALPAFSPLDTKVNTTIKSSTVFKVKVFDLRGITIYSSERAQVGEDKYNNQGWRMAAGGHPASEITHRDRFSAFEGVVENRDLISTYVPVTAKDGGNIIGVFEIYSDVTPFLAQIKTAFAQIGERNAANQAKLDGIAAENQSAVEAASHMLIAAVGLLLMLLYAVLLLIVRHGQRMLDAQARAQALFIQREERWHREKMAALAAMAATVAHEIGNPLAVISALADTTAEASTPALIREQVGRIAAKTRQMADFAATRSETQEPVDVNQMVRAVCDFLAFDRSFRATTIDFTGEEGLPACNVIPDHLTEVLMNLLQGYVEHDPPAQPAPGRIAVETQAQANAITVRITCDTLPAAQWLARTAHDPRMAATQRRVAGMGGTLRAVGTALALTLPPQPAA